MIPENQSSLLLYQTPDGQTRIEAKLEDETVWLTQAQMAEIFDKSKATISEHISNIYEEGELLKTATVRNFRTVQIEGERQVERDLEHYNLKMFIAIGFRVKSHRGVQFRNWANWILSEYTVKGFAMDDMRLKEMGYNNTYFDELLERIRDIRTSEKNFYHKICEIYKLSADYDPENDITKIFFKQIQNKFHFATHGHTASELVYERADATKDHMGLTTWKTQGMGGNIRKSDVVIAKNYLSENELKKLNLLVEQFLAFAETQAMSSKEMYMRNWIEKLGVILEMNDMEILKDAGTMRHDTAEKKAEIEYEKYKKIQDKHEIENLKALEDSGKKVASIKKKSK